MNSSLSAPAVDSEEVEACIQRMNDLDAKVVSHVYRSRSGRTTGRTFAGRSGLVSGEVYERQSAASVYEREGRESNQQKPHFERDGVRAQSTGQVLIRPTRGGAESTSVPGRQFVLLDTVVGGCRLESSD